MFLGACQVIALKFGDPNLTPGRIAQDMNVSTRTLARVFAVKNETIMRAYSMNACARRHTSSPRQRRLTGQLPNSPLPVGLTTSRILDGSLPPRCM